MGFLSHDGTVDFPYAGDQVFTALLQALPLSGLQVENSDPARGEITAKSGASLTSWGERVTLTVVESKHGHSRVQARSASKGGFLAQGITDLGKNRKNLEKTLQAASQILGRDFGPQAASPRADASRRLAELKSLLDQQLITAEEYESKKVEILDEL